MIQHFSFTFFLFVVFATQLFSTPVTSSNFRNQALLFTELRLLQGTLHCYITRYNFSKLTTYAGLKPFM